MKANVEASAISKSTSTTAGNAAYHKNLINAKVSRLDIVFPMMDSIFENTHFPVILDWICTIFLYFQLEIVSLWPFVEAYGNDITTHKYIVQILWFMNYDYERFYLLQIFVAYLALFLVFFIYILVELIYYSKYQKFNTTSLYFARFIVEFAAPILTIPYIVFTGACVNYAITSKIYFFFAIAIVGLLMFIFFFVATGMAYSMQCRSALIVISPHSAFDPFCIIMMLLINSIAIFIHFIFRVFPSFSNNILQIIHCGFCIYLTIYVRNFSFHKVWANVLAIVTISSMASTDFFVLVFNFIDRIPRYVPIAVMLILFFAGVLFYPYPLRKRVKVVVDSLKYPDDEELDDGKKFELFTNLGLDKNESKALMYLRLGFTHQSDMFLDWSLFRYIAQAHNSTSFICSLIQIVCYFPSEYRKLNSLFTIATNKNELSFPDRFLIYQAYRVNSIRQSSSLTGANERLSDLKNRSLQCEQNIRSFWMKSTANLNDLSLIDRTIVELSQQWENAIRDYPNNSKFSDEYSRFLAESATNFTGSIFQRHRADMIESGRNFAIDKVFRCMVRAYPAYLKKNKLDFKGNILNNKTKKNGSSSHSSSKHSTVTSSIEVDAELEENLGKQTLIYSKMRLAMHNATKGKTTKSIKMLTPTALVLFFVYFFGFIILFAVIKTIFKDRRDSMQRLNYISKARFAIALSSTSLFFKYAKQVNIFTDLSIIREMQAVDAEDNNYIDIDEDYSYQTRDWAAQGRSFLTMLLKDITALADEGVNVYDVAYGLLHDTQDQYTCDNVGGVLSLQKNNVKNLMLFLIYIQSQMSVLTNFTITSWLASTDHCEMTGNWQSVMDGAKEVFASLEEYQRQSAEQLDKTLMYVMFIMPTASFFLAVIPGVVSAALFFKDLKYIIRNLLSLDSAVKAETMKPIMKTSDIEECDVISTAQKAHSAFNISMLIFFCILSSLIEFFMMFFSRKTNTEISKLNSWQYFAAHRASLTCEAFYVTLNTPILTDTSGFKLMSQELVIWNCLELLKELEEMNNNLLQGTDSSPPCYGYDDQLDAMHFDSDCEINQSSTDLHDTYRCASASQGIAAFKDFMLQITGSVAQTGQSLDNKVAKNFFHLSDNHLMYKLVSVINRIQDLCVIKYDTMSQDLILYVVFGDLSAIITLSIVLMVQNNMRRSIRAAFVLIKHIPPLELVKNQALLNVILDRNVTEKGHGMGISQSVISNSRDAVIGTGLNGVIEIVNPAVTSILGYKPEQLLGQQPVAIFTQEHADKLAKQMTLMKNKQSSPVYEDHFTCISDSTEEVPCHMILLSMFEGEQITSFVIILRDETELLNQQKDAEQAKAQSENLLFHILPRDIVIRLNRGEKDISFTVPSCSIIFIDIQRFSDYSSNLTPQEIMGNLSMIFAAFDTASKKYPLLTKIKLIGDDYMAAAGLFMQPEEPAKQHAEQIVRFGLDCLTELEDINVKLNANLCARVGVNSGGPIIAGVLGTDKPVFDIIGDTINVAARLQTTDKAGKIQIPQSTFDLISGGEFNIEKRGEVYLKGKGQTMAYFVLNQGPFVANMSSMELLMQLPVERLST